MTTAQRANPFHLEPGTSVAFIHGRAAHLIARATRDLRLRAGFEDRELADALDAIHRAGLAWANTKVAQSPRNPTAQSEPHETHLKSGRLGTSEASHRLGIAKRRLAQLAASGNIPATKTGPRGGWEFDPADIHAEHLRRQRQKDDQ